jgi:hypothetical protein
VEWQPPPINRFDQLNDRHDAVIPEMRIDPFQTLMRCIFPRSDRIGRLLTSAFYKNEPAQSSD